MYILINSSKNIKEKINLWWQCKAKVISRTQITAYKISTLLIFSFSQVHTSFLCRFADTGNFLSIFLHSPLSHNEIILFSIWIYHIFLNFTSGNYMFHEINMWLKGNEMKMKLYFYTETELLISCAKCNQFCENLHTNNNPSGIDQFQHLMVLWKHLLKIQKW